MAKSKQQLNDAELADQMAKFYGDPLGFVRFAYPWGEPGHLERYSGPDPLQTEILKEFGEEIRRRGFDGLRAVKPIRLARTSGHGVGKTVLAAFIENFVRSTRAFSQGTVTANSWPQLETKTWAAISWWGQLCITAHWFNFRSTVIEHREFPKKWKTVAQSCKEENSESFAGQHAHDSTSFYIFDECSNIPPKIFEVAEGGLSDGEPMIFLFGNPTRSSGQLYDAVFGRERDRWNSGTIDARDSSLTNKEHIREQAEFWGEDSDFFRVRVAGLPPRASDLQFIGQDLVAEAQRREVLVLPDEPLIAGIDIARGGLDSNVIRYRRGLDARSIRPIHIPGSETQDTTLMVSKIVMEIEEKRPAMVFLDATGVGGPLGDRLRQLGFAVTDIQFGASAPSPKYANMRAYMWFQMRDWLSRGAIDKDYRLELALTGPGFGHKKDRLILESKEDVKKRQASPDDADALCLTFAQPIVRQAKKHRPQVYIGPWS